MSEVNFEFSALARLEHAFLLMPETFQEEFTDAMGDVLELMREPVAQPGERPTYPINWASEKQRRAFFATDGFGRGIPTPRTDGLVNSWQKAIQLGLTGLATIQGKLFTNSIAARFVLDENSQSPIFRGFWKTAQPQWQERTETANQRFGKAVVDGMAKMREMLNV